jgi:hypothetical protein
MNTAAGLGLFLIGSFALLYATTHFSAIQYYTGGIVIGLFIAGLFYSFGNAIRQGLRVSENEKSTPPNEQKSQQ